MSINIKSCSVNSLAILFLYSYTLIAYSTETNNSTVIFVENNIKLQNSVKLNARIPSHLFTINEESVNQTTYPLISLLDYSIQPNISPSEFSYPVGSGECSKYSLSQYRVSADMLDPLYFRKFNSYHTGEDWNRGSGDSDLGDPVCSIASGLVIKITKHRTWSHVILIRHWLSNGKYIWSQYAHLDRYNVKVGDRVNRGQQIGTIGKQVPDKKCITSGRRSGLFCAHLHFEIRQKNIPLIFRSDDLEEIKEAFIDPTDRRRDTNAQSGFIKPSYSR